MEYIFNTLSMYFDLLIKDSGITIIILALFLSSLSPQSMAFRVTELLCITISLFDVFITGSTISAIVLVVLLGPRIPLAYVGIICALLSASNHLATGGVSSIIATAVIGVCILLKSGNSLTFSIPFSGIRVNKAISTASKTRNIAIVCFVCLWLTRGVAYFAPDSWMDEFRFTDNLIKFSQDVERISNDSTTQAEAATKYEHGQEVKKQIYYDNVDNQNNNFFDKYLYAVTKRNKVKGRL